MSLMNAMLGTAVHSVGLIVKCDSQTIFKFKCFENFNCNISLFLNDMSSSSVFVIKKLIIVKSFVRC